MSFNTTVALLISCLDDLSIDVNGVQRSPALIVLLSISPFMSINIYFIYLGTFLLDAYISIQFISFQSLSRVRLFATPQTAAHQASLEFTQLLEFTQTHVHYIGDAIQPSLPLSYIHQSIYYPLLLVPVSLYNALLCLMLQFLF